MNLCFLLQMERFDGSQGGFCLLLIYKEIIVFWINNNKKQMLPRQYLSINSMTSDLNRSAKSENLTQNKKSKAPTINHTTQQLLQLQIVQLKQKAHQSFMQVIQIQQLHQQQIQTLRQQYNTRCDEYQTKIATLTTKISNLQQQNTMIQKNYQHHLYQFQKDTLSLNIQPINFQEQSQLDDSSILNFEEIIESNSLKEKLTNIKQEIVAEILIAVTQIKTSQRIINMVEKLFEYVSNINRQFITLHEINMKLKTQNQINSTKNINLNQTEDKFKSQNKNIKYDFQNIQKENKLFSDKLKRISSDKMKIQKTLVQTQKKYFKLEENFKKIVEYLNGKGLKVEQLLNVDVGSLGLGSENPDNSLDLNQFIEVELSKKISGQFQSNGRVEIGAIKRLRTTNRN